MYSQDNNLSLITLPSSSASLRRTGIAFLSIGIVFLFVAIGMTIVRLLAFQPCIPSFNCSLAGRFKLRNKAPRRLQYIWRVRLCSKAALVFLIYFWPHSCARALMSRQVVVWHRSDIFGRWSGPLCIGKVSLISIMFAFTCFSVILFCFFSGFFGFVHFSAMFQLYQCNNNSCYVVIV